MTSRWRPLWLIALSCLFAVWPGWATAGAYADFFTAIKFDDATRLRHLLIRGFDPNTLNEDGSAGLVYAMQQESPAAFSALLSSPSINPNVVDTKGDTPLMVAAAMGRLDWVQQLIHRGAELGQAGRWTALHYAASAGSVPVIQALVQAGSDVNVPSENSTTPLMMAARSGREEAVRQLLELGADPSSVNDAGFNAAGYALRAKQKALAFEIMRKERAMRLNRPRSSDTTVQ
ncbi:ankyrin repeat domain-containing protein [Limnobacter humi]|uniref:Ankyrin repeat domain-containing protein n=1 Tax=Limnobacter humi TaxID=1778671 RepID=A0ABT1WEP2_9BURK|nr:ankyrin repeat domain-containing protein [Limnobacter humi]MCQ8895955.1 ankyrin repeat domain-containing protein [Limnobacter humi]